VSVADLQQRMEQEVQRDPTNQPELRIEAKSEAHYDVMAKVLAAAKNAQMLKIGFVQ
jgi:biopolymer transport protein ExbD